MRTRYIWLPRGSDLTYHLVYDSDQFESRRPTTVDQQHWELRRTYVNRCPLPPLTDLTDRGRVL